MNQVILIGRIVKDFEVKVGETAGKSFCKFTIAIDRGKDRNGEDMGADFPNIICFGKTAENCGKFLGKGSKVAVNGVLTTGKYEKDGKTFYTTDVKANFVEFLDRIKKDEPDETTGFSQLGDDMPF